MSEFLGWEFQASSSKLAIKSGSAIFHVGNKEVKIRFECFADAQEIYVLITKAYKSGRYDGIAEVRQRINDFE